MNSIKLACDYLVVGAGAASMAFIDTLLTQHPSTKIVRPVGDLLNHDRSPNLNHFI